MVHNKLPMIWTLHLPSADRKQFANHVSVTLEDKTIKRLIDILLDKREQLETKFDYSTPSWAYQQAHNNGKVEMIEELLTLITSKDQGK